jgi:hypothetical protein
MIALAALISAAAVPPPPEYAPAGIADAQLFERIGHAVERLSEGAYRVVARSVSNLGDVWLTEMFWNGNDYKVTVRQAGFTTSFGQYRGVRWRQDANGIVLRSLALPERDDPFALSLSRSQDAVAGAKLLGLTKDPPAAYVVDVRPARDFEQLRYYDAQTYLLSRVESTNYRAHKRAWIYKSYSGTRGAPFPTAIDEEIDGVLALRTSVVTFESVPAGTLDLDIPESKYLFDLNGREEVEIPARFTDEGIIVSTTIDGRGLDLYLDSGASDLLIDTSVARELATNTVGDERMSFAGSYTGADVRVHDFSIGGLSARDVAFMTAGFHEQWLDLPGYRIVGWLGCDVLANGPLEVNFEKQKLTLYRTLPSGLAAQGWSALPLTLDECVPVVNAAYSGHPGQFIVDLGAEYSDLFPHYFSQFPIKIPKGTRDQAYYVGPGLGLSGVKYFTMNNLVLGDWVFGDVQVMVPSNVAAQEPQFDGLIGRNILSNFNLIFDYKDGELWFKPIDFGNK